MGFGYFYCDHPPDLHRARHHPRPHLCPLPTCRHFSSLLSSLAFFCHLQVHNSSAFLLLSHPQFSHRCLPLYDPLRRLRSTLRSPTGTRSSSPPPPPPTSSSMTPSPSPGPASSALSPSEDEGIWTKMVPFLDGSLYFTTFEPFSVVGFDLQNGAWDITAAPALSMELAFVRLVGGGDRLYLVDRVGRDGISRSLRLWELVAGKLDGNMRYWEELERLPEMMCRKFVSVCYHNYSHVQCLWHKWLICVFCTTWPEVLFYKVSRGTWHWFPRCPMLQEKWSCGFKWFSFVPDLFAAV